MGMEMQKNTYRYRKIISNVLLSCSGGANAFYFLWLLLRSAKFLEHSLGEAQTKKIEGKKT